MRKDVRLGLGVGGILFAVVLVYALFFAGDRKTLGEGDSSEQANASVLQEASAGGAAPSANAGAGAATPKVAIAPPANNTSAVVPPAPSSSVQVTKTPDTTSNNASAAATPQKTETARPAETEVVQTPRPEEKSANTGTSVASSGTPGTSSYHTPSSIAQWDWSKALQSGAQVPAVSETPGGGRDPGASRSTPTTPRTRITDPADARTEARDSSVPSGKYLVKSGETFWTIAMSVYGDASYFPHIQRANPKVTPKSLKAGMTINLPPKSEVVPPGADAVTDNASRTPVAVDPMRQYKVRSGDSLSIICERLYGNAANVDKLYQLNKDLIGPNPSALKVNMVLKLPEAPRRGVIAGAQ